MCKVIISKMQPGIKSEGERLATRHPSFEDNPLNEIAVGGKCLFLDSCLAS